MRSQVLLVAAIVLAGLSACGAEEQPAGEAAEVATLQSAAPSAAASKASQRPRERLDTTPEEWEQMLAPYYKCMREQGAITKGRPGGGISVKPATEEETKKYEAANRICEPQYFPLPAWEKDPANPEARDFAVAVVKCLKIKGVEYVAVDSDGLSIALGGDDNDAQSIRLGMELIPDCERQVAAKNK
ncbi:hypothetical protein [Actinoplanes sp. G11-F43]|uniref:hypothetical protein n=1 Tax=Actinoplanes sp. G11-F43 TaxID=3424130 RepID=UPI003D345B89